MIGQTVSHYKVLEKIGEGGMGEIYLADDTELDRRVAIKFLPSGYSSGAGALERFRREAKAAAALNHPNIITIYDFGTHEGLPYIVMEHIDGEPLTTLIDGKGLAIERVLEIATQIFDGLEKAHDAGVVHRDIKPDNILIDSDGRVRILDFGLAKLHGATMITSAESTLGTAAYMSPEQTRGGEVDARSDLFSAGVVLYEMVAGQRPFAGEHREALFHAITTADPQPLRRYNNHASDGLERLVAKVLAKDPESRYPSAKGVLVDLRAERRESGTTASMPRVGARRSSHKVWIGAAFIAVVALVVGSVWFMGQRGSSTESANTIETPASAGQNSIAVLPFADMSPNKDHEYFSDGISEELLNVLAKIPELRVTSRSSAFSYKGKDIKIADVAQDLNVAHILEGSVRKAGDRVRITAQLIEARSDTHLWSETYDRTLDDIFAVQDEIAADVLAQLKVTLLGEVPKVRESDPKAYALYLQGRHLNHLGTAEGYDREGEIYREALAIDADYAMAWDGLASVYINQTRVGRLPVDEGSRLARDAAEKALAIDPDLASAHARLAWISKVYDNDLAVAARQYARALQLDPRNVGIISNAAVLLRDLGRMGESIVLQEYVVARDPVSAVRQYHLGSSYYYAGRSDEAIASFRAALTLSPDMVGAHYTIGQALLLKGEAEAALEAFQEEGDEEFRVKGSAMAYHALSRKAEFESAFTELRDRWGKAWPSEVAQVYAWIGDTGAAFEWLDNAIAQNEAGLNEQFKLPLYASLRGDPRWQSFRERTGTSEEQLAAIEFDVTLPE